MVNHQGARPPRSLPARCCPTFPICVLDCRNGCPDLTQINAIAAGTPIFVIARPSYPLGWARRADVMAALPHRPPVPFSSKGAVNRNDAGPGNLADLLAADGGDDRLL